MDRPRDRRVFVGGIVDGVVAEGNIADHRVEEIIRQRCLFKPLREDRRVGIELFRDPGRDAVQLDSGPPAAGQQRLRHQAEEMPDAQRGLKDVCAGC